MQLDYGNFIHYNPTHFLEDNNITESIQKFSRGSEWFTTDETIYKKYSIISLNIGEVTMYTKVNAYGVVDTPVTRNIFTINI